MSETAELAKALAAVQAELPEVKKTRTAKVEKDGRLLYTYDYADLADVSAAILPILGKHELAFTAFPGHQPDVKFGLWYALLHSSGASKEGFFQLDDKGGMQLVGGRITYARRYTLCAVTGVIADEDVDAKEDSPSRTVQRKPPQQRDSGGSGQPVQRRPQSSPPAQAVAPRAAAPAAPVRAAGGDLPPLPGEEDAPGPGPASVMAGPGAPEPVTPKQLTAIWTVLSEVFLFGKDERDEARKVCAHVVNRELASSKDMSKQEAGTVLDTLAHWEDQAQREDERPRAYLQMMIKATGGDTGA